MTHFEVQLELPWLRVTSPTYEENPNGVSLGVNRRMYREFKDLEMFIEEDPEIRGWLIDTELENIKMIRLLTRLGGKPYKIDLSNNHIWFYKLLGGG